MPDSNPVSVDTDNVSLFFSYAHKDAIPYLEQLQLYINKDGCPRITTWYDQQMLAGEDIFEEINNKLDEAHIVLFLVSPYFQKSDFISKIEFPRALSRRKRKLCEVIPIKVRACNYFGSMKALENLKSFPEDGFLNNYLITDGIWDQYTIIQNEINRVVNRIIAERRTQIIENAPNQIVANEPRSKRKIFLSVPMNDRFGVRDQLFAELEENGKKQKFDYEIVPGIDEAERLREDIEKYQGVNKEVFIESHFKEYFKDVFYSVHIALQDDIAGVSDQVQFRLAKAFDAKSIHRKLSIFCLGPGGVGLSDPDAFEKGITLIYNGDDRDLLANINAVYLESSQAIERSTDTRLVFVRCDAVRDMKSETLNESVRLLLDEGICVVKRVPNRPSSIADCSGGVLFWGNNDEVWFKANAKDMVGVLSKLFILDFSSGVPREEKEQCVEALIKDRIIKPTDVVISGVTDLAAGVSRFIKLLEHS